LADIKLKICFIGDIVGNAGRRAIRTLLPDILRNNSIDCCIINAENSAHGLGVTSKIVKELESIGADAVTLGNHTFSNSNFMSEIGDLKCVVRPANITPAWRGKDYVIIEKGSEKLGIINLLGQIEMMPVPDSPFTKADELISLLKDKGCTSVFVDFHAEATSEKQLMGYYLDGKVTCVAGTHTHIQTADERILAGGTGYITDAGMTGAVDSVLGMKIECSYTRIVKKLPCRYEPADGPAVICGIIFETNNTGRCLNIKRFCEYE